jgi:hypothetical protein
MSDIDKKTLAERDISAKDIDSFVERMTGMAVWAFDFTPTNFESNKGRLQ